MQIQTVQNQNQNQNYKNQYFKLQNANFKKTQVYSPVHFGAADRLLFKDANKLNILSRNETEMKEVGEYFHKCEDWTIKCLTHGMFFGRKKSQAAYQKLSSAIKQVLEYKKNILNDLAQLENKKTKGILSQNEAEKIESLRNELQRLDDKADMVKKEYVYAEQTYDQMIYYG